MKANIHAVLIILAILVLNLTYSYSQEAVNSRLSFLDHSEKESLELLFASLVMQEQFGHTLISEKPMSFAGGFIKTPYENVLYGCNQSCLFWRRWGVWKSHFGDVKFPNFLILEENSAAIPNIRFVFIINKALFLQTVNHRADRFREITRRTIDPSDLLTALEEGSSTLQQAINFSDELLGILLGYGQHNAALFAKGQQIEGPLLIPLALAQTPSPDYSTVQEEAAHIWNYLQASSNRVDGCLIEPVRFGADKSDPATTALCKRYIKAQSKLSNIYKDQIYLETSLKLLLTP